MLIINKIISKYHLILI